jgi:hypothetical protein
VSVGQAISVNGIQSLWTVQALRAPVYFVSRSGIFLEKTLMRVSQSE